MFYGALYSERFIDYSPPTRGKLSRWFRTLLEEVNETCPVRLIQQTWPEYHACPPEWVQKFEQLQFDLEEVRRLRGFWLTDKHSGRTRVRLEAIDQKLGRVFCDRLYRALCDIARSKAKNTALRDFANTLNAFVSESSNNLRLASFSKTDFMRTWLVELQAYHFTKYVRLKRAPKESTLPSLQKLWSRYLLTINALGKVGIWALPSVLPQGKPSLSGRLGTRHRRQKQTVDGTVEYTQKLLTAVPLYVTDERAIDLLFKDLDRDLGRVLCWSEKGIEMLRVAFLKSSVLEKASDFSQVSIKPTLDRFRSSCPNALANIVWVIRNIYNGYVDTVSESPPFYPEKSSGFVPKETVAQSMGFLSKNDCFYFAVYLMAKEPRLTESALLTSCAFATNGQRLAPVKTDSGPVLAIKKNRGKRLHELVLSNETRDVIELLLTLTDPLRQYMRKHRIAGWQNLFIYCRSPLGRPVVFKRGYSAYSAFRMFTDAFPNELEHLVHTMTLSQVRSTAAVVACLRDLNVTKLAEILGNSRETALKHYLPDSIWDFFCDRWIRIFQNLLIARAVRGTKHHLPASDFKAMKQLHAFLTNHCFKEPPKSDDELIEALEHGPVSSRQRPMGELIVLADTEVWGLLLSLKRAVKESNTDTIAPWARYWAEFMTKLQTHVEDPAFPDAEVKAILARAKTRMDPSKFQRIIHA